MNEQADHRPPVDPARSFDLMADAYDRGRPSYPDDAVARLLEQVGADGRSAEVLELGAGTGKLTEQLLSRGCSVTATDRSEAMLGRLLRRCPQARAVCGTAEQPPVRSRSVDLVVAAQAFDWFDPEPTLREVARVLRPGGRLAVVWNSRDERIPWVKRLGRLIGSPPRREDPAAAIDETGMFAVVERATFRFWQPMTEASLRDLVRSRSTVAVLPDHERDRLLRKVDDLYAEYGRGHDGMLLPYVTTLCLTDVLPWALPQEPEPLSFPGGTLPGGDGGTTGRHGVSTDGPDDDELLIDFR